MENQDKIFEQFKNAAEKAETKDFPEMEKIWSRVDAKLDTVVYKKQNNNWKKLAVAASVVLVGIIVFQFLKTEDKILIHENEIVISESKKEAFPKTITKQNPIVSTKTEKPVIKSNAEAILQKQINNAQTVVVNDEPRISAKQAEEMVVEAYATAEKKEKSAASPAINNSAAILKGNVFDAVSVNNSAKDAEEYKSTKSEVQEIKNLPLVVIDGKTITNNKKSGEEIISELDKEAFETVFLKEPLYIINGSYYTEESLFGTNPTSPYAPLDEQEITTIKILQDENAIAVYGEKGKKGVIIISTKTGKPVTPK